MWGLVLFREVAWVCGGQCLTRPSVLFQRSGERPRGSHEQQRQQPSQPGEYGRSSYPPPPGTGRSFVLL